MRSKDWLNINKIDLQAVVMTFLAQYPLVDQSKLNGETMRKILAGELFIVRAGKREKFELWPRHAIGTYLKRWNERVSTPFEIVKPITEINGRTLSDFRREFGIKDLLELSATREM